MRFDWADLRIFLHVCDAGSMTAAAARCHLTLAAVSARMRKLEEANGLALLERQPRGVAVTPAGALLAAHARLVFEQVQRLERDLLQGRGDAAPPAIVLLANSSALARPLAEALAGLDAARPLTVRESSSEASVQALRSGAADIAIVSDAVDTRGLLAQDLGDDPLLLVVPRASALADLASVRFEQALAQPWVAWGEQGALATHLALRALAQGLRMDTRITYPELAGVLRLVARGAGVTVLPRAVLQGQAAADVVGVPIDAAWARRRLLVCRPATDTALRRQLAERIARAWPAG